MDSNQKPSKVGEEEQKQVTQPKNLADAEMSDGFGDLMEEGEASDDDLTYDKEFVHKFFTFTTWEDAANWISGWYRNKKHNATQFTSDLPALMDKAIDYRQEILEKNFKNPEQAQAFNDDLILQKCIKDYGMFQACTVQNEQKAETPSKDDYIFHFTFCLLQSCCQDEDIPSIIPRILLNNLALKLVEKEVVMVTPRHQDWAMDIFDRIRSDLVPDFISKLKVGHRVTDELLRMITQRQIKQNRFNDASLMIVRYKFQEHFDLKFLMMRLVDLNKLETAKLLIQHDDQLKIELIKSLSTNDSCKKAAQLIKDFRLNPDDFPEVKERIMKSSMRYYLGRYLYKKQNQQEFMTLDRIEDLLSGFKQMISYLVEDLVHKDRLMEAKGIFLRNQCEGYVRPEIQQKLNQVEYKMEADSSLQTHDAYASMSKPVDNYIQMPEHVKIEWISSESDIQKLSLLLDEVFIGVDSEWRPSLTQYHKTAPSLFQISGTKDTFLIDLVSLQKSKTLNDMLTQIFSNPNSTIIGFSFSSDIEQFARKLPHLTFIRYVKNFIDAQSYFGKVYLIENQTGLAKVAQRVFNKSICKVEQMSNWERRPLRNSQMHYAALDAYIMIDVIKHLIEKAEQDGLNPFRKYVKTLDNRKMLINNDSDDDNGNSYDQFSERIVVKNKFVGNKRKQFNGSKGNGEKVYGNSYNRKSQTNNSFLITNDELRASMWKSNGFIVDRNLFKLCRFLQEKGIDCIQLDNPDSEYICSKALEQDRIFITSNLKLFNRKSVINRCCVHFKDSPYKQYQALKSFFSFD